MKNEEVNLDYLCMEFFQHYCSGKKVRVEFPDGSIRQGRVGVSQTSSPQFWLIVRGRTFYEIDKRCRYVGPEKKSKTRSDCQDYLNGKVAAFRDA